MTTDIVQEIEYSKTDLQELHKISNPESPVKYMLEKYNYDPNLFKQAIGNRRLKKLYTFIYLTPRINLPLKINDPFLKGLLRWRLCIGK